MTEPSQTAPQPADPADPASATSVAEVPATRRRLTPAAIVLIVVAAFVSVSVVVAAAVAVPMFFQKSAERIRVAEYDSMPSAERWSVLSPFAEASGDRDQLGLEGYTVGQDRALLLWSIYSDEGGSEYQAKASLVDTRTGDEIWQVDLDGHAEFVGAPSGSGRAILSSWDDESVWSVVDLGTGEISTVSGLRLLAVPESLDGDIIATDGDSVGRYSLHDLEPRWTVLHEGRAPWVGPSTLIVGESVYSLTDGAKRSWRANPDSPYIDLGGFLMTQTGSSDAPTLSRVNEETGSGMWSKLLDARQVIPLADTGLILVGDESAGTISVLRLEDGTVDWSIDAQITPDGYGFGVSPESGAILLPITGDRSTAAALDLRTGEQLYEVRVSDNGDWNRTVLAMTERTLYLSGGEDKELQAIDVRTGTIRWTMPTPFSNWYDYAVWGGNLVAYRSGGSAGGGVAGWDEHPHVLGVG